MIQLEYLPFEGKFFSLALQQFVLLRGELFREDFLFVDHDVKVLLCRDHLPVDIVPGLLERDHFFTCFFVQPLHLALRRAEQVAVVDLAVKLCLKALDCGAGRVTVTFGL